MPSINSTSRMIHAIWLYAECLCDSFRPYQRSSLVLRTFSCDCELMAWFPFLVAMRGFYCILRSAISTRHSAGAVAMNKTIINWMRHAINSHHMLVQSTQSSVFTQANIFASWLRALDATPPHYPQMMKGEPNSNVDYSANSQHIQLCSACDASKCSHTHRLIHTCKHLCRLQTQHTSALSFEQLRVRIIAFHFLNRLGTRSSCLLWVEDEASESDDIRLDFINPSKWIRSNILWIIIIII